MDHAVLSVKMKVEFMESQKLGFFWKPSVLPKKLIQYYFRFNFDDLVHVLRIYDITHGVYNGKNVRQFYEIAIPYDQGYWFVKGLRPNRKYLAELGVKMGENKFFPIFRSNAVKISPQAAAQYDFGSLENLQFEQDPFYPQKWRDHVSTYSYYEGTIINE